MASRSDSNGQAARRSASRRLRRLFGLTLAAAPRLALLGSPISRIFLLLLLVAGCQEPVDVGFGVALTLKFDGTVDDSALGRVARFSFADPDQPSEHGERDLAGRPALRTETVIYRPQPDTRSLLLVVDALDPAGALVASGATSRLSLKPGHTTTATVELSMNGPDLGLAGDGFFGEDLSVPSDGGFVGDGAVPDGFDLAMPRDSGVVPPGQTAFAAGIHYGTGNGPHAVVTADFDGDGVLDLATVNATTNGISILRGAGDGSFSLVQSIAIGEPGWTLAAGDFNHDGHVDIMVASWDQAAVFGSDVENLYLLTNQGNGQFTAAAARAGGAYVVVADFNHDFIDDLMYLNVAAGTVSVQINTGTALGTAMTTTLPNGGIGLVAADFDGDQRPDFATLGNTGVDVFFNRLSTTNNFVVAAGSPHTTTTPPQNGNLAAADFDNDGDMDLVVADQANGVLTLVNPGNGNFAAPVLVASAPFAVMPVTADFDENGKPDIAFAVFGGRADVGVLKNLGGDSFGGALEYVAGRSPRWLAVGDFNGDHHLDLAVADREGADVTVILGRGDGTLRGALAVRPLSNVSALTMADYNGDTHADVAIARASGIDRVLTQSGGGFIGAAGPTSSNFVALASGRVDGDAVQDLIAVDGAGGNLAVLLGDGVGGFATQITQKVCTAANVVAVADFNNDGTLDAAVGCADSTVRIVFGPLDLPGSGFPDAGTMLPPNEYAAGGNPVGIAAGDLSGDNKPDLVVTYSTGARVFINDGAGTLVMMSDIATTALGVAIGDLDGDTHAEVILGGGANGITLIPGGPGGALGTPRSKSTGIAAGQIVVADFDGDGDLDVATVPSSTANDGVLVAINDGHANLTLSARLAGGGQPQRIATGDFDGDGKSDLAIGYLFTGTNPDTPGVSLLLTK